MSPQNIIDRFKMQKHPEGGYYAVTYESEDRTFNDRAVSTAIYFLITEDDFSAFHRIDADELWHFYGGEALEVIEIDLKGNLIRTRVDSMNPQYVVKKGHWFGSRVLDGGSYSFVGCTVAPGFLFEGFELAKREELTLQYPQHERIVFEMTRL